MSADPCVENNQPQASISENGDDNGISTKDRKKFKKLRKRVARLQNESERSGLLTCSEWQEYQRIQPNTATGDNSNNNSTNNHIGPSIHLRKGKEAVKVEGSQHRDLLAFLMGQILHPNRDYTKKSKRKRHEINDPIQNALIPSWACIHNPGTIQNVAVLEIQVPGDMESYSALIQSSLETNTKSFQSFPTKWFQGYLPKSLSDALLYFAPNKIKRSKDEIPAIPSMSALFQDLQNLTIPKDDWAKEGYPVPCKMEQDSNSNSSNAKEVHDPSSIPLEEAKTTVNKLGVRIENQDEDDNLLYIHSQRIDTDSSSSSTADQARVFGMDCEMVLTSAGSELARITLIQLEGFGGEDEVITTKTVLDELVKPENAVVDYVTKHSGITAKLLEGVSTRLAQVQVALLNFLQPNDILVGHSLENDLRATRFIHPNVIDTALIFRPRNKKTKFSLRHLAAALLKTTIQTGSHCSEEDAKATLDLAVHRAWLGDTFALADTDERISLLSSLTESKATSVCIGPADWIQCHVTNNANSVHALNYIAIDECKKAMLAWLKGRRKVDFMLTKVTVEEKDKDALTSLLNDVTLAMDPTTILLVVVQGYLQEARDTYKIRRASKDPRATVGWPLEKEQAWNHLVNCARSGRAYWASSADVSV